MPETLSNDDNILTIGLAQIAPARMDCAATLAKVGSNVDHAAQQLQVEVEAESARSRERCHICLRVRHSLREIRCASRVRKAQCTGESPIPRR
jgi:hypothetical protein